MVITKEVHWTFKNYRKFSPKTNGWWVGEVQPVYEAISQFYLNRCGTLIYLTCRIMFKLIKLNYREQIKSSLSLRLVLACIIHFNVLRPFIHNFEFRLWHFVIYKKIMYVLCYEINLRPLIDDQHIKKKFLSQPSIALLIML